MGAHSIMILVFKRLFSKLKHASCNWGLFTVPAFVLALNGSSIYCGVAVAFIVSERCANSLFTHVPLYLGVAASDLFKSLVGLFALSVSGRARYHGGGLICAVARNLALLRHILGCLLFS